MQPSEVLVIEFLTHLFQSGVGYSTISSAKAAVINFISLTSDSPMDGSSAIFQKFMRGIFSLKPALPKYGMTWDAALVLKYLRAQSPPDALTLLALSQKLAMLFLLLTGQRGQSIHQLGVDSIENTTDSLVLTFPEPLKTTRPGRHCQEIVLPAYKVDKRICIVHTYKAYITRTCSLRKQSVNFS